MIKKTNPDQVTVLFVCLGNICRSPTAHGVFQRLVNQSNASDSILIDSAGTGDWHIGHAPDRRATRAASERGYDLSELRARQVEPEDFEAFDFILAMDHQNLRDLQTLSPDGYTGELDLFLRFANNFTEKEVPDPYYGGDQGFENVLNMIEDASQGLLDHIRSTRHG